MPLRQLPQEDCLGWLRNQGIEYDGEWNSFRYRDEPSPGILSKSWKVPEFPGGLATFWENVFSILPAWKKGMMLYPRDAMWATTKAAPDEAEDLMYSGFFRILGINLTQPSGIYVPKDEKATAAWILYTRMSFGWCVGDDTIFVPEEGNFLIQTSHHDFIDVQFRDKKKRDDFDTAMSGFEYDFVRWTGKKK